MLKNVTSYDELAKALHILFAIIVSLFLYFHLLSDQCDLYIFSNIKSPTLIETVKQFEDKYDIKIKLTYNEDVDITDENIKKLATSSNPPDIIISRNYFLSSETENKYLKKLDEVNTSKCFTNIIKTFTKDEKYAIPYRFFLPILGTHNQDELNNIKNTNDIVKMVKKYSPIRGLELLDNRDLVSGIAFNSANSVHEILYFSNYNDIWLNGFDKENMARFLTNTKHIIQYNDLPVVDNKEDCNINNSMANYINSNAMFFCEIINRTDNLAAGFWDVENKKDSFGFIRPVPNGANSIYIPSCIVMALENTKNEYIIDFIDLLFSEEIQSLNLPDGIAVNRNSFKSELETAEKMYHSFIKSDIEKMVLDLEPVIIDEKIYDKVWEIACAFYIGNISLEETVIKISAII